MVKGLTDLSVVMVMTGGAKVLAVMEWLGRLFLGGGAADLLTSALLDISWEDILNLRSVSLNLTVGALLPLSS